MGRQVSEPCSPAVREGLCQGPVGASGLTAPKVECWSHTCVCSSKLIKSCLLKIFAFQIYVFFLSI